METSSPDQALSVNRRRFVQGGAATLLTAASYRRVLGANERVGVGFIGYGLIGKRHVLDFQTQADASLRGVAEAHQGRLEEALGLIGGDARGYRDFRELLDQPDIDAVVVSTPDHWHALVTLLACAAGKDVYVEKPMTLFVREGRWMIEAARRHGRVVQVGTQQRSGIHYQRARELIQSGHIGDICSVRMRAYRNIMPGYGSPPDGDPPPELDWDLFLGPAPMRPYNPNRGIYHFRWFWDTSGGQMTNLGQHRLDIVDWCLPTPGPLSVSSMGGRFHLQDNGETPDTQDVLFEYPGFTAIWSHRETCGANDEWPLEFCGTKGRLAISRSGFTVSPDRDISPANTVPQFAGAHPVGGPVAEPERGPRRYRTQAVHNREGNAREQLSLHARNFLDCVKSRKTPVSDVESGHRVVTACHLANLSLRLGRKLRWDAVKEQVVDDAEANQWLTRPYRAPWDRELQALRLET